MITVSTLAMAICVFAVYIMTPIGFTIFAKGKNANKINKIASVVGIASFCALLALFTLPRVIMNSQQISLFFETTGKWFSKDFTTTFDGGNVFHTVLNTLMLSPLGVMSVQHSKACGKKHSLTRGIILGLITGTAIETLQWALPIARTPDIYDILLNTAGASLGATGMVCVETIKTKLFPTPQAEKQEALTSHLVKNKQQKLQNRKNLCDSLTKSAQNAKANVTIKNHTKVSKPLFVADDKQIFYPEKQKNKNVDINTQLKNLIAPLTSNDVNMHNNNHPSVLGG